MPKPFSYWRVSNFSSGNKQEIQKFVKSEKTAFMPFETVLQYTINNI